MRISRILMTVLITAFVLMAMDAIAKDDVYRWVDENGVVHFSNQPNDAASAEKVDIQQDTGTNTQPGSGVDSNAIYAPPSEPSKAQQQREERAKNRKAATEKAEAVDAGCAQRRQIVAQLEPSTRVMVRGEDGEVYRLDDNERLKAIDEAKAYMAEKCDKP